MLESRDPFEMVTATGRALAVKSQHRMNYCIHLTFIYQIETVIRKVNSSPSKRYSSPCVENILVKEADTSGHKCPLLISFILVHLFNHLKNKYNFQT